MKKRIIPLFFLVLLLATVMIPTSAAISTKAISGVPSRFMRKFICRLRLSEVSRQ